MNPALSRVGIASLPSRARELQRRVERLLGGGHAAHDLDQLHHLRGVEVVQADELLGRSRSTAAWSITASEEVLVAKIASALTI